MVQGEPSGSSKPLQQTSPLSRGLLNLILVFLESAISLALRLDSKLRQLAYPLAESGTVVCIRTYLPHTKIYATFSYQGVLLDDSLPSDKASADITINAYSFQLANILGGHDPSSVDALQIRGENQEVEALKAFLTRLGIGGAIQSLLHKVKGKPQNKPSPEQKAEKIAQYKEKIQEQAQKIDALTLDKSRLSTQLSEIKTKQKSTLIGFIIAVIAALVSTILHFI